MCEAQSAIYMKHYNSTEFSNVLESSPCTLLSPTCMHTHVNIYIYKLVNTLCTLWHSQCYMDKKLTSEFGIPVEAALFSILNAMKLEWGLVSNFCLLE